MPERKHVTEAMVREALNTFETSNEAAESLGIRRESFTRLVLKFGLNRMDNWTDTTNIVERPRRTFVQLLAEHNTSAEQAPLSKINITSNQDYNYILPVGDIHDGHVACDWAGIQYIFPWIYNTEEAYVVGMGDYCESSIMNSPGLFDQTEFVDKQFDDIVDLFAPIAEQGRLIGLLEGNHERRIRKIAGFDITKKLCTELKTKYLGVGAFCLFNVRHNTSRTYEQYKGYFTHGESMAQYAHTKMQACIRLQQVAEAEFYCMGHVHSLLHQKVERFVMDENSGEVVKRPTHFILTGCYLKYLNTYAHQKNLAPSGDTGSPKIKLHNMKHVISVSL
jgi:hypothetical protein